MSRRLLPILPPALCFVAAVAAVTLAPGLAHAADAGDTAKEGKPKPAWLKEKHILEVGGYLGAFFTAADHGLYGDGVASTARPLKTGFDVGLRIAYMPLRFVGIEAEGGVVPTKLDGQGGYKTTLFAARAHVILQTPTRLALFVVAGGGMLGVSSGDKALGKLELKARNDKGAWNLDTLSLQNPDGALKGKGVWNNTGRHQTRLDFELTAKDVGKLLDRLGFVDTVRRGTAGTPAPLLHPPE